MSARIACCAGRAPCILASSRGIGIMNDKFWIRPAEPIAARNHAGSGFAPSHRGLRGRQARPLLDTLEDRCLLSFGSPSLFDNGTGGGLNAAVTVGDVSGDNI